MVRVYNWMTSGLVVWLASRVMQMSTAQATDVFILYSAIMGNRR